MVSIWYLSSSIGCDGQAHHHGPVARSRQRTGEVDRNGEDKAERDAV